MATTANTGENIIQPPRTATGLNEFEAANTGIVSSQDNELHELRKTMSTGSRASRRMSTGLHPVDTTSSQGHVSSNRSSQSRRYSGVAEIDAPAPVQDETQEGLSYRRSFLEDSRQEERQDAIQHPLGRLTSKERFDLLTTFSWLIFFSIFGAIARVGLSALTAYPGSPLAGVIWANFAGSFVMGFMAEEIRFFAAVPASKKKVEDTSNGENENQETIAQDNHWSVDKKAIPLYIGITTGFCGSLTSFSSWMRDIFWAMSNTMPHHDRHRGYNVEALLAQLLATVALSVGGLKCGAHMALFLRPVIPTMPKGFRPHLDILALILGPACWIGITMMAIFIPKWRGIVLFAGVFAPIGTMLRFGASKKFNPMMPTFPVGTFIVNVGGSLLDASFILLQSYSSVSFVGCEVLQGLEDGLCGCLTTVSTWVVEITSLRRGHAYVYGSASVLGGVVGPGITD
ncbi:hypothetical protein H072_4647 [Dactylellina haptotyla CBS 200.50]|uniref:Uncharacterized protein n=1 Tax=Dactylellina haptotyla (strain CBS 200.50) TaxID=1284197 RepID=S8C1J8_DACHA|nr:hypothetical protein H072_4647 [Dactylellina haptotyla CBS 200.50]